MQLSPSTAPLLALALTSAPALAQLPAADLLIDSPVRLSNMGDDGKTGPWASSPQLAYNSAQDEFLIVWYGTQAGGSAKREIYGQRIDAASGLPLGDDFKINTIGPDGTDFHGHSLPSVAYCDSNDRYLVVWQGGVQIVADANMDDEIWGQLVDGATGALVGSNVRLSSMGAIDGGDYYFAERPHVTYNPQQDEFLVVWGGTDDDSGLASFDYDIFGQRVSPNGVELGTDDFRISDMGSSELFASDYATEPCVAWSPEAQTYLVAWTNDTSVVNLPEVYAQRLDATGALVGARIQVSSGSSFAITPRVVSNPDQQEFLIAWEGQKSSSVVEIYAQRIDAHTGLELGGDIQCSTRDTGWDDSGGRNAGLVYVPARKQYFIAFDDDLLKVSDEHKEVFGQWLDGATGAEIYEDDFAMTQTGLPSQAGYYSRQPAVALRPGTDELTLVFEAATGVAPLVKGEREVYAQRLLAPVGAQEVVRLGTPPNPNVLLPGQTSGPVLGSTWDPIVDHSSFLPNAQLDILGIHAQSFEMPSNIGTFLAVMAPNSVYVFSTPGVPFAVPAPVQLTLMGAELTAQAASIDGSQVVLSNALDIVLGVH